MAEPNPLMHDRHPVLWRVTLFIMVIGGILWLGTVHVRALIGNDMLKFGTLEFDTYLPPDAEREIFRLLSISSIIVIIGYVVTLISSIVFLATSPYKLKEHGWLMMSAILFYLFVPAEIFTLVLDAKIVYNEFFTTTNDAIFRELFIARVAALKGAPLIGLLCYYTIIGLVIFRPFTRQQVQGS